MANHYKHGTYGEVGKSIAQSAIQAGTVLVYIGTAAVNLVRGYRESQVVNYPVKLLNMLDAQRKVGYSSDWDTFTLCEPIKAHFNNIIGNIGPITFINVLDPDVHRKQAETIVNLSFTNGRAEFVSDTIILDTLAIEDKVEDVDFFIDYNYTGNTVVINSVNSNEPITGTIEASYYEVDSTQIDETDIIGGITEGGEYSGLGALTLLYQNTSQVPNILCAPGWSHIPAVYNAMVASSQKINGHWESYVIADIPIADSNGAIDTIPKAKQWRENNGYISEMSTIVWPKGQDALGDIYHLSTCTAVEMLKIDFSHNSVPFETPSNKQTFITKQYFGANSKNKGYDQQTANELNEVGISTIVYNGGRWVLWGGHTAAYKYGADVDPRAIFDVNIRMLYYILNSFQREWAMTIDEPMTRQLADRIINREQEKLDALVVQGALIGSPEIRFDEVQNPISDLMNGDFTWNFEVTPTPPFKSGTGIVSYTDSGFRTYYTGGES